MPSVIWPLRSKTSLQGKVRLILPDGDNVILIDVLRNRRGAEEDNRNVYRLNPAGDVVWQIQSGAIRELFEPFTNIYYDDAGVMMAYCSNGVEYPVDLRSGALGRGELIR